MSVRVAINGFGRIGRLTLRAIVESGRRDIELRLFGDHRDPARQARHEREPVFDSLVRQVFDYALNVGDG